MRRKVEFDSNGVTLSGAMELPESGIRCYALFAHCFTCGKDVAAASRISRALTAAAHVASQAPKARANSNSEQMAVHG